MYKRTKPVMQEDPMIYILCRITDKTCFLSFFPDQVTSQVFVIGTFQLSSFATALDLGSRLRSIT